MNAHRTTTEDKKHGWSPLATRSTTRVIMDYANAVTRISMREWYRMELQFKIRERQR